MTYKEALNYLEKALKFGIKPGLERIKAIAEGVANPQRSFPAIHITGTNGKTSTAWFISSFLASKGLRTGTFISPHLHSYRERISINGEPISEHHFSEVLAYLKPTLEEVKIAYGELTEFEILTAMSFLYFAQSKIDCAVFEVGMGGRWDATNLIEAKVAVITNIALEHTDRLGKTLKEIAWEKAHIIKPGSCVVIGDVSTDAYSEINHRVRQTGSRIIKKGLDFGITNRDTKKRSITISGVYGLYRDISVAHFNVFQESNLCLAIAATEVFLEHSLDFSQLKKAVSNVIMPARLEIVAEKPPVIIDGAHNPQAIRVLLESIESIFPGRKLHVVLAILRDKDIGQFIRELSRKKSKLFITRNKSNRAAEPQEIQKIACQYTSEAKCFPDLFTAIDKAVKEADSKTIVLITGSLYTAAEAREIFSWPKDFPAKIYR
jgi:dihydrofolate synthase/folylpolyglutamate synthase